MAVTDSLFGNDGLWSRLERGRNGDFHLLSRLRSNLTLYALPAAVSPGDKPKKGRPKKYGVRFGSVDQCASRLRECAETCRVFLYGKQRDVQAFSQLVMLKTMKCPVRVVWVFRKSRYVALVTTDLSLSVEQIIEFYGARWQIEIDQPCCLRKSVWDWDGGAVCCRKTGSPPPSDYWSEVGWIVNPGVGESGNRKGAKNLIDGVRVH